jgi:hypothetical protein
MNKSSLHDQVAKLHAELAEALRADPKSREALSDMMRDINRLIDNCLTDKGADTPALARRSIGNNRGSVRGRSPDSGGECAAPGRLARRGRDLRSPGPVNGLEYP